MAEADPYRSRFQCSGTFMGKGCAMQPRPDRDPLPCQQLRCAFTVHPRHKGYGPRLMGTVKDTHPKLAQSRGADFRLLLFPFSDFFNSRPLQIAQTCGKSRNTGYI